VVALTAAPAQAGAVAAHPFVAAPWEIAVLGVVLVVAGAGIAWRRR
jgi:hypothetical protein